MSNVLTRNPLYLDTFTDDVVISSDPIRVMKIRLKSATDGDILVLEDKGGNQVVWLTTESITDPVECDFGPHGQMFNGLQMDVSDCTGLGANDLVWIFVK